MAVGLPRSDLLPCSSNASQNKGTALVQYCNGTRQAEAPVRGEARFVWQPARAKHIYSPDGRAVPPRLVVTVERQSRSGTLDGRDGTVVVRSPGAPQGRIVDTFP